MRRTFAAQRFKEASDRLDHIHVAGDGLNDDASDVFAMLRESCFDTGDVVVIQDNGVCNELWRDAR